MVNTLVFLYGLLFSLPLTIINILPSGLKLDDIVLCILIAVLINSKLKKDSSFVLFNSYALIFILTTLCMSLIALIISINNIQHYIGDDQWTVFFRVIQSILIITAITLLISNDISLKPLFNGIITGAAISLIVFLCFFYIHFDIAKFITRGVYFTKDIFQYLDYNPFTIHVNTLGSLFIIPFFIIIFNDYSKKIKFLSPLFLLPSILLISKGDLVALLFFFAYSFFNKNKVRRLFFVFLGGVVLALMPSLLMYYSSLQKYRLTSSDRDNIYHTAIVRFLEQPAGYGLGSQNNIIFSDSGINFPAHNFLLSTGLEFGWLYLLLVTVFFSMWLLKSNVKVANKVIFTCYFIIGFFGNAMYFYKYHTLALCLAMFGAFTVHENMLHLKQKYCQRS